MSTARLQAVNTQLHGRQKAAHTEARHALNQCHNIPGEVAWAIDMAGKPWWQYYVASQNVADEMATIGITGFACQPILGVKDPNRHGKTRIDFIVSLKDGSYWRLHPGSKPASDAIPKHITAVSEAYTVLQSLSALSLAPSEHYLHAGPHGALTADRARETVANDRMGKAEVWRALKKMEEANRFDDWDWQNISDGVDLQWWRWLANIAENRVGRGVRSAWVRKRRPNWFEFTFGNDPDPAQPNTQLYFIIMIWKERGRSQQLQVE